MKTPAAQPDSARRLTARGSAALRASGLITGMLLLSGGLLPTALQGSAGIPGEPRLAWWQLAVMFACAEVLVFHVESRGEAHSFSLSEIPFLLALVFAPPAVLITARMTGEALALMLVERQRIAKLAFNLTLFVTESCLALTTYHLLVGSRQALEPHVWVAALSAVGCATVFGAGAVWLVVGWHGEPARLSRILATALITAACNSSLATVIGIAILRDRWALIPLAVVALVLVAAYRGYARLSRRYSGLELLYRFTRSTSGAVRSPEAVENVLGHARTLMRAEVASISLLPTGQGSAGLSSAFDPATGEVTLEPPRRLPASLQHRVVTGRESVVIPRRCRIPGLSAVLGELDVRDLLAAPLVSGTGEVVGTVLVANRLGHVTTFDAEDARLFTAFAAQAGIALDNGRLLQRLHDQVQAREHEALHDALTGLPNRALFSRQLGAAVDRAASNGRCAVLLMDLDQFKEVNDTLGHHIGDQLLEVVGDRLHAAVGDRATVARLGGDEFAVLMEDLDDAAEARELAEEIYAAISRPVKLSPVMLAVAASIGIAVLPEHAQDPSTLMQRADVAMYAAKRGQDRIAVYDPGNDWNSELRLRLAGEIRGALDDGDFDVHYQPIVRVSDGAIVTAEALIRWNHPELGELPPDEFIQIAERTGAIEQLTLYVLDQALRQCRAWQRAGLQTRVAVNLPVQVMLDAEWPERVFRMLRRHRVRPGLLTLEITETTLMSDPARTISAVHRLADAGIMVAIDDFGTGYSSLSYLQRLPVSEVKIDKSFVQPMVADPVRLKIVRSIVELASSLGLTTVAEGVEDQPTLDCLAGIGCGMVQGHWLSHPVPAAELTARLLGNSSATPSAAVPAAGAFGTAVPGTGL